MTNKLKLTKDEQDSEDDNDADNKIYFIINCSADYEKEDAWQVCLYHLCFNLLNSYKLILTQKQILSSKFKNFKPGK